MTLAELQETMDPKKYIGYAPQQVTKFIQEYVNPILLENKADLGMHAEINV